MKNYTFRPVLTCLDYKSKIYPEQWIAEEAAAHPFRNVTARERAESTAIVSECVQIGFSIPQIVEFLKMRGIKKTRATLYRAFTRVKVPRSYRAGDSQQSPHDNLAYWTVLRLCKDAADRDWVLDGILKNRPYSEMLLFRPDLKFEVGGQLFFMDMQLQVLNDGAWTKRYANYVRMHEHLGESFKVLFILDKQRWMDRTRYFAQQALYGRTTKSMFVFATLEELADSSKNTVFDPIWRTAWDEMGKISLIECPSKPNASVS